MSVTNKTKSTLCWKCRKATNSGCSWSRALEPVDGWEAEEDHLITNYLDKKSYFIYGCPEFEPDRAKRCEDCRHFETKGNDSMYGYCRMTNKVTDINRSCKNMKRRRKND
jgi:hypothetical protein